MQTEGRFGASSPLGWCLVALQFFFAITWTVYVLYLPNLFDQAHLPRTWLLPVLMGDQIVFAVTDLLVGLQADRVRARFVSLGRPIAVATAISCLAFVALPFVAPVSGFGATALLGLVFVWAVSSAALRVPPILMLEKHAARPVLPWLSGLTALGMGLAALAGPFLTIQLRGLDPRLPFALSSAALLVTVLVLLAVEHRAGAAGPLSAPAKPSSGRIAGRAATFIGAILVLAFGFQLHTNLASPRLYLKFASAAQLPYLLPVFWIGFNLAVLPATWLAQNAGGLRTTAGAAVLGGAAIALTLVAGDITVLLAGQVLAGVAWCAIVTSAFVSALFLGGHEGSGRLLGLTFASFAVATFGRMAITFARLPPEGAVLWSPPVIWIVAGLVLALLAAAMHLRWTPVPRVTGDVPGSM